MRDGSRTRSWVALWLRFLGVFLLGLTFFVSWYAVSATQSDGGGSIAETFSATSVSTAATWFGAPTAQPTPYDNANLPATGTLYEVVVALVLLAAALGIAVAGLANPARPRTRRRTVLVLSIAAVALAVAAPVLLVAVQPVAVCSDSSHNSPGLGPPPPANYTPPRCPWQFRLGDSGSYYPGFSTGPGSSYVGTTSDSGGTMSWGSGPAWYLCVGGAVLLAGGQALESIRRQAP